MLNCLTYLLQLTNVFPDLDKEEKGKEKGRNTDISSILSCQHIFNSESRKNTKGTFVLWTAAKLKFYQLQNMKANLN